MLMFFAVATAAEAQSRPDPFEITQMAAYDDFGPDPEPARGPDAHNRVVACVTANNTVGRTISRASWKTTTREISRGGYLTFDEAESVRVRIYNETAYTRELLRRHISTGDVSKCNSYRDRAVQIVRDIMIPVR